MESQIVGPPGTGKTHAIDDRVAWYRDTTCPEDGQLIATSYSNTAVQTLRQRIGRHFTEPELCIATMHSLGYGLLDRPRLLGGTTKDSKDLLALWNSECPQWRMTSGGRDPESEEDGPATAKVDAHGDTLMAMADRLRHLCVPEPEWVELDEWGHLVDFWPAWQEFKRRHAAIDFTDMIALPLAMELPRPYRMAELVVDEFQDCSPLMIRLARQWESQGAHLTVAYDDDQSIMSAFGADPREIIHRQDVDREVLPKSYRIPASVHRLSQAIIERVSDRLPKEFEARDEEGEVVWVKQQHWGCAGLVERYAAKGSVMVIASTNYMASSIASDLRGRGMVFHNPFRPKNSSWNPIHRGRGVPTPVKAVLGVTRYPNWTWDHVAGLADILQNPKSDGLFLNVAALKRGAKQWAGQRFDGWELLNDAGLDRFAADPEQYVETYKSATESLAKGVSYGLRTLRFGGPEYIFEAPNVVVGTVHSVKGAEADTVIISPDLSPAAMQDWARQPDATHRLFYVAVTRAKQRVVLLARGDQRNFYRWPAQELIYA